MKRFITHIFESKSDIEKKISENLTIPQNSSDKIESELYKKLEKNYDHADRIVRWYRNAKKNNVEEKELKKTFIDNIDNIKDLFNTYEKYIEQLKKNKMLNKKIEIETNNKKIEFDPVKDIDKIRRLEGFQLLVKTIGDKLSSGTNIDTSNQKYAIIDEDRSKIRIIGFTENVVCWCTEGYETTNKFIYQLWQNSKTLGRGDVYGDPSEQTPYCTHSKEHWDDYSEEYEKYQQFWFLLKLSSLDNNSIKDTWEYINKKTCGEVDNAEDEMKFLREKFKNVQYQNGNLANENVAKIFNLMKGTGPKSILAMNDTGNDFLDRNDEHFSGWDALNYGDEIKKLTENVLDRDAHVKMNIGGKDIIIKNDRTVRVNGEREKGYTTGDIRIDGDVRDYGFITSLEGCPEKVKGKFQVSTMWRLQSLKGCPKEVEGLFMVVDAPIDTLEGCPKVYADMKGRKEITIGRTEIKNLKGIDPDFDGHLEIFENELTSFEGMPEKCNWLEVDELNIESLKGLPGQVSGTLDLTLPKLKSLDYAPKTCKHFDLTNNNNISFDEREEYKKYREVMTLLEALSVNYKGDDKKLQQQTTEIIQKINYWYNIHTMPDRKHYKQSGPTQYAAVTMDIKELKKLVDENNSLNESVNEGLKTSQTKSDKFEVEIKDKIENFLHSQKDSRYSSLNVEHYEGDNKKYFSDVKISNPKTDKNVWVEVKKDRYANLGSASFKYTDGKWTCTTTDEEDPLSEFYLELLNQNSEKFISFCKEYLKKDDIKLPTDLSPELIEAWKKSGNIEDTDNDVQFITEKIPLDNFGDKIAEFYKNVKTEPVYYIQVDDDLYIIDKKYNPLDLYTHDRQNLKTISEAYRIGRIQFRAKGLEKKLKDEIKYYYNITMDVKILSDKENQDKNYKCSFKTEDKWPVIGQKELTKDDNQKMINESDDIKFLTNVPEDNIKNILDNQKIENKRYERAQFTKYFGINETNWVTLNNKDECLAIAAIADNSPFKGYTFIQEVQTLKKGYGKQLLQEILNKYKKVSLMANTTAGEDLINYYRSLKLKEILVPDSVYECPAYFFCTKECDYDKLEEYFNAFYSNDNGEENVNESDEDREYAYHVSNVPPEKIKKEGFKSGLGNGGTDINLFQELYDQDYPKNYLFISKEPWDIERNEKFKYCYKIDITDLDLYPDFGMLIDNGAYYEDDGDDYIFYWKDKDIKFMKNKKLKEFLEKEGGQMTVNQMMGGETNDGEYFPDALYDALGSAVVDGDNINKKNRIVDVEIRKINEVDKDIGGKKSEDIPEVGIKIWIDDVREAPKGFKWFKSVNDFIDWCHERNDFSDVSLVDTDHDAGDYQKDGGDYIRIFDYLDFCEVKNVTIHIHSANPVGANNIRRIISKNKQNGWKEVRNTNE